MKKYSSYSLIIRTLIGGGYYRLLLESIKSQTVQPKHVYVVQPEGYDPPEEQIGTEEFIYTKKGMWQQRICGMEYPLTQPDAAEYMLVCDDDVAFAPDFAEQMMEIANRYEADAVVPSGHSRFSFFERLKGLLTGARVECGKSPYKVKIMATAGFQVNPKLTDNVTPTQSGNFQCFVFRTAAMPRMDARAESWLDETEYALPDDQVFFYKAFLSGLKIFRCENPVHKHLDGGSQSSQRLKKGARAGGRNFLIFWHRFLFMPAKSVMRRGKLRIAIGYRIAAHVMVYLAMSVTRHDFGIVKAYLSGVSDARKYLKSPAYRKLPRIVPVVSP